jgi:hypothetical protein
MKSPHMQCLSSLIIIFQTNANTAFTTVKQAIEFLPGGHKETSGGGGVARP